MLQRAASNAYSWWWASHIRTRRSKWLEQNLQDVEDKVKYILKIIDEDADSFAKRAEMYYRKRPELINFVEETYRAYRALAERYDHISGELQNANNTIATVFPGQVHFGIEEEDEEEGTPERKIPTTAAATKIPKNVPDISKLTLKVPKSNKKVNVPSKQVETEKAMDSNPCKEEASEEIDKLQKSILILQTEKEFMKSSYETALAKFWEIEKQITERQKKVCNLQDEHSVETVIEDDEARALMAATALKSCGDTLAQLQEQHMKSTEAARIESKKIMVAEEKLRSLKGETLPPEVNNDNNTCEARVSNSCSKDLEEDVKILNEGRMELESICQKVKQYLKMKSDDTFSVTVLAEMIDELVNKVLTLETAVSSQTALLERLRTETDELQRHLQALEEEKASVVDDSNSLTEKIKEMEEDLHEIHNLSLSVKDQNNQIRTHFNDACRNLDDLSEKLHSPQKKDTIETSPLEQEKQETILIRHDELLNSQTELNGHLVEEVNKSAQEDVPASPKTTTEAPEEAADKPSDVSLPDEEVHVHVKENIVEESPRELENKEETVQEKVPSNTAAKLGIGPNVEVPDAVDDSLWQQLLLNGLDNREKILLTEYTSILRNYKDTKKRLSEVEKKNQETMFQTMAQVRELKSSNAMKDLEIRLLKQKLGVLNTFSDENSDTQLIEIRKSHPSRLGSKLQISRSAVPNFFSNTPSQVDESVQNAQLNGKSDKVEEPTPDQEEIMVDLVNEPNMDLTVEEKFRRDIDELLEVNLEFWLRFSNSFHQIQKFHAAIQELKSHISKIKESKKQAGSSSRSAHPSPQLEVARIDKSLRELQSQLSDWLDQSALHREELQCRLLSLSRMQDEIARVLDMGSDLDQAEFTAYQAAKFQGEVLNIQQENTTVHEELQAGVDYVRSLHAEIEKILSKLNEKFNESSPRNSHHHHHFHHLQSVKHSMSRTKIPLRSFLFGAKPKKSKQSILACMTPSLQLQKQHSDMNAARKVPM